MTRFPLRYNRVHAVVQELRRRSESAYERARMTEDQNSPFAAAMRGKARGYNEAAALVEALEKNQRIGHRVRWLRGER